LIIGMVLGQLSENYLFISVDRYGLSWLWDRPIVVVIEVFAVLTMAMPFYKRYFAKRETPGLAEKLDIGEGE
jgi:TctA family transporter